MAHTRINHKTFLRFGGKNGRKNLKANRCVICNKALRNYNKSFKCSICGNKESILNTYFQIIKNEKK